MVLVTAASGQDATPVDGRPHTITVSSSATISTKPDEAVIMFSVHTQDADSTVALNENARIMNDVLAAMTSLGIEQKDMETTNIGRRRRSTADSRTRRPSITPRRRSRSRSTIST